MTDPTPPAPGAPDPARSEAEMAGDPDALAGRAILEARVARCTPDEQDAFWKAVRHCFGAPEPEVSAA